MTVQSTVAVKPNTRPHPSCWASASTATAADFCLGANLRRGKRQRMGPIGIWPEDVLICKLERAGTRRAAQHNYE